MPTDSVITVVLSCVTGVQNFLKKKKSDEGELYLGWRKKREREREHVETRWDENVIDYRYPSRLEKHHLNMNGCLICCSLFSLFFRLLQRLLADHQNTTDLC